MSTTLVEVGPHDVLAQALVTRGLGTDPAWWLNHGVEHLTAGDTSRDWPVFKMQEPDRPDEVITVYETTPREDGKTQVDAQVVQHWGLTVRVRGRSDRAAGRRARLIARTLNEDVYDMTVTVEGTAYELQSVKAAAVPLNKRQFGTSQLWLYNVNCLAVILARPTGR